MLRVRKLHRRAQKRIYCQWWASMKKKSGLINLNLVDPCFTDMVCDISPQSVQ